MTDDSSAEMSFYGALQRLGESDPNAAAVMAKKELDRLDTVTLNIAVTGEAGAGKSSFVNALRDLSDKDENSAPTGLTETTKKATMYTHPTKPNVRLWDLPGIGTPNFKANKYLKDVKFETYDFFIIISSERFKENDVYLAKEIQKKQKRFYFVRNKIDNDIRSAANGKINEQQLLCAIREDCYRNLKEVGNPKVFLISSFDLGKYDFENLIGTLESELTDHKGFALVQSVPVYSLAMLEKKKAFLEKFIWLTALASSACTLVPNQFISLITDKAILIVYLIGCHYALGLNEKSLKQLSERTNKPVSLLKLAIKSPVSLAVLDRMRISPMAKPVKSLEDLLDSKNLAVNVQNTADAFRNSHTNLTRALNEMIKDMRQVLQVAGLDE